MRTLVTGAAGSGTTTLSVALAARLHAVAVEADAFFWLPTDPPYKSKREPEQRRTMFERELLSHERCVVAGSVMGWGVEAFLDLVVFLYVETSVRIRRLQAREEAMFGHADPEFLQWAAQYDEGPPEGRGLVKHEAWLRTLRCPVIRLAGELPATEQIACIVQAMPNSALNLDARDRAFVR